MDIIIKKSLGIAMLQALNHSIEKTFNGIAKNKKGYKPRDSQQLMVRQIASTINNDSLNKIITIEGQTGCGKSLAFLVPMINQLLIHNSNNKERIHLVIATANVALQQQLINHELPILMQSGLKFTSVLAAGRGRYLCQNNAMKTLEDDNLDVREQQKLEELITRFANKQWDGLKDNLSDDHPLQESIWPKISASKAKCHKCPYADNCGFIQARQAINKVDVIIANHSLVWSDLEKNTVLPSPKDTMYVFDEAHHLPKSYRDTLSRSCNLNILLRMFNKNINNSANILSQLSNIAENVTSLSYEAAYECCSLVGNGFTELKSLGLEYINFKQNTTTKKEVTVQFTECGVPTSMQDLLLLKIAPSILPIIETLEKVIAWGHKEKTLAKHIEILLDQALPMLSTLNNAYDTLDLFSTFSCKEKPLAHWINNEKNNHANIIFNVGIVNVGRLLKANLFDKAISTCLVSATLRSLGKFDRFLYQIGLTKQETQLLCIESPFDYNKRSILSMIKSMPTPNFQDETAHTQSIVNQCKLDFKQHKAGVMLFSSRKQMTAFVELLDDEFLSFAKLQYTDSRQSLIEEHKAAIDRGEKSLLIGCQSLSEGMDLPRQYLTFVGIAKIPFGDISNPIDNAEAIHCRRMNGNPFRDIMLADASSKLIQSTGRLMRTVECQGQISIYDSRLLNKPYGQALLNTLPSFNRHIS